jgi:uncharacterized repeat protein (TIGR02543 family)
MKRKNINLFLLVALSVLLITGLLSCNLELSPENGVLEIHLGGASRNINWLPEIKMDIASYTITGIGPNEGDGFVEEGFTGATFTKESLAVGEWEITVDGYNDEDIRIGTTNFETTIRKSRITDVTASMTPLLGVGTLDVSVSWSDSLDKMADPQVYVLIQDQEGNDIPAYQNPIQLTLGGDGKSAAKMISDIPIGWYEVSIGLYEGITEGDAEVVWQGVYTFRIVKDEITEGIVEISEEQIQFGVGSISLIINEEMNNPFAVSFTGLPESVKEEQEVSLVATGAYGDDATYRWYVNGVRQGGTASEFAFSSNTAGSYTISLLVSSGGAVGGHSQSIEVTQASEEVAIDKTNLVVGYLEGEQADSVLSNVGLPTEGANGTRITWESNDESCISATGVVTRPAYSLGDTQVQLTATVERGTAQETKSFNVYVIKLPQTDEEAVAADKASLEIVFAGLDSTDTVTQDVTLTGSGDSGTTITWESSEPATITTGGVVTRPDYTGESDVEVTLTATISKGAVSDTKTFTLTVKIILQEQTVTFVSNGGSSLDPRTVYWGRLIEEPEVPTKVGYSFEGWFTDSELTEQWDFVHDYVRGDINLYARWSMPVQVTFNAQGGVSLNPASKSVNTGKTYGELASTIKAGHTLIGWYTEPDGEGTEVAIDTIVTINSDHTLYAAWQANTLTITFDAQGGSVADSPTKEVTYEQQYGQLPVPTRENHTFDGWWTGEYGTGIEITEETFFTGMTGLTLYAKWFYNVFTGPAGGLVFYENPNYTIDGWRYLEAAPYGWYKGETHSYGAYTSNDDPEFQWGAYGYEINPSAKATGIGSGATNTENIVNYHNTLWTLYPEKGDYYINPTEYYELNDGTVAAKICAEYSVNIDGIMYDGWFLPSKDELNLMYRNLYLQALGGFSDGFYWSSSDYTVGYVYPQRFSSGYQGNIARFAIVGVRPVRAF